MGATVRAARESIASTAHEGLPALQFGDWVMRSVNDAVGFDGYHLFAVDPITGLRSATFAKHGLDVATARLMRNETVEHDVNRYAELVRRPGHVGVLAMRAVPEPRSPRLHEILRPQGYQSELRLVLIDGGRYWGGLSLFRDELRHPFTDTDAESAADLSAPLGAALRRHQIRLPAAEPDRRPAGVILIGSDGRLLTVSHDAQTWLGQLTTGGRVNIDDASRVVYEVAHAAASGHGDPVCRVRTNHGRWLVISATRTPAPPVDVTVVIQPADLHQTLPAFAVWCGLSSRETQVLHLVAAGLAAKQIARRLDLSILTVNDHLRATYRKAGTSGREELLALIT